MAEFTEMFLPPGEPIKGKTYIADGWVYRGTPQMLPEFWGRLLGIIGPNNYVVLTKAEYEGGKWKRGQLLVSPEGMGNIKNRDNPPPSAREAGGSVKGYKVFVKGYRFCVKCDKARQRIRSGIIYFTNPRTKRTIYSTGSTSGIATASSATSNAVRMSCRSALAPLTASSRSSVSKPLNACLASQRMRSNSTLNPPMKTPDE
jgi:hypothetical protein